MWKTTFFPPISCEDGFKSYYTYTMYENYLHVFLLDSHEDIPINTIHMCTQSACLCVFMWINIK